MDLFLAQGAIDSMVKSEVVSLHAWVNKLLWGNPQVVGYQSLMTDFSIFLLVVFVAAVVYLITRKIVVGFLKRVVNKTKNKWDDQFLKSKILSWVSLIIPVLIVWKVGSHAFGQSEYRDALAMAGEVLIILLMFLTLNSLLNIAERIYRRYEVSKKFPVKGFIQVIKIIMLICASIFIISSVIGKSPFSLFAGLGAMSAVLMFIFKDSILGLVAGIQLSANQMVSRGDWVEVPKFNANGEVLEVALTTVKIRNWDKTITTLPTYALISDSFKNWRGMSESGVRRIKRSLNIDMQTVGFLNSEKIEELKKVDLLKDYLVEKQAELTKWNKEKDATVVNGINSRSLTNLGTFRAYVLAYLKDHDFISKDQTLMVRQLEPTIYGLPLEIYVFSSDNRWVEYEGIQSDIFDHLVATLPTFGLKAFQRPSGTDFDTDQEI